MSYQSKPQSILVPIVKISISAIALTGLSLGIGGCGGGEESANQPQATAVKLKTLEFANKTAIWA